MKTDEVVIVHLRRPGKDDRRDDPFWEFGSFGITGCHNDNILSQRSAPNLQGRRVAFAQGGREGTRLVLLTPPVSVRQRGNKFEIRWDKSQAGMPFRYSDAPILVRNDPKAVYLSDFPKTAEEYAVGVRPPEGQFASSFRSRTTPIEPDFAQEIIRVYDRLRKLFEGHCFAKQYQEALPWTIANPDGDRRARYKTLLAQANGSAASCKAKACVEAKSGKGANFDYSVPDLRRCRGC